MNYLTNYNLLIQPLSYASLLPWLSLKWLSLLFVNCSLRNPKHAFLRLNSIRLHTSGWNSLHITGDLHHRNLPSVSLRIFQMMRNKKEYLCRLRLGYSYFYHLSISRFLNNGSFEFSNMFPGLINCMTVLSSLR